MSTYYLLSWGANSHGQLGHDFMSEEVKCPEEVSEIVFESESVRKITGGAGHTLILDRNGRVFTCGWNSKGQAGIPGQKNVMKFSQIRDSLESEFVTDIACGWDSSAAITKDGTLFVWGSNVFGQLGQPEQMNNLPTPTKVNIDEKFTKVSMGLRHTVALTENHEIFVTGENKKGQLGLFNDNIKCNIVRTFTKVPVLKDVEDISCGQYHTIAKTKSGAIYVWGDNKYGQLGDNENVHCITIPTLFPNFKTIVPAEMYAGWNHTAILTDGCVYAWGRNTYGQLGYHTEKANNISCIPKQIECTSEIRQLAVGSLHSIAVTNDGEILSWGWNEHGNCGNGTVRDVFKPESIKIGKDSKGILIGTGAGHSFAVISRHIDNY